VRVEGSCDPDLGSEIFSEEPSNPSDFNLNSSLKQHAAFLRRMFKAVSTNSFLDVPEAIGQKCHVCGDDTNSMLRRMTLTLFPLQCWLNSLRRRLQRYLSMQTDTYYLSLKFLTELIC
jgi:hypothetical protein